MLTVQRSEKRLAFNKYLRASLILGQSDFLQSWLQHRNECHSIPIVNLCPSITFSIIPKKVKIGTMASTKKEGPENVGLTSPGDNKNVYPS